jgi:epsilon-lactone hydrolase
MVAGGIAEADGRGRRLERRMDQDDIAAVRRLLASQPRPTTLAERRERLDAVASVDPVASDIHFEVVGFGGVPGEKSLAPGADPAGLLVYFHGGGYSSGSIKSHRRMVAEAGRAAGVAALAVGYRLAPEHPFPAALDDALAVWEALIAQGFEAGRIAVGGDSAGGGLALALMISLQRLSRPLPACAWLVSPWVDLTMTGASLKTKADVDPLISAAYLRELADAYLAGHDPSDPLASPLNADLSGLPPLLIQVGSAESLLDDSVRLAGRAGEADVAATLQIWPHMIHAWPLWAARLQSGRHALVDAGAFIRARLSSRA